MGKEKVDPCICSCDGTLRGPGGGRPPGGGSPHDTDPEPPAPPEMPPGPTTPAAGPFGGGTPDDGDLGPPTPVVGPSRSETDPRSTTPGDRGVRNAEPFDRDGSFAWDGSPNPVAPPAKRGSDAGTMPTGFWPTGRAAAALESPQAALFGGAGPRELHCGRHRPCNCGSSATWFGCGCWTCAAPIKKSNSALAWEAGYSTGRSDVEAPDVSYADWAEAPKYAKIKCSNKKRKGQEGIGGSLKVVYLDAYRKTSLCVQALVREHEEEHLNDTQLLAACVSRNQSISNQSDMEASLKGLNAAIQEGECARYPKDIVCLEQLLECCEWRKTAEKKNGLFCCACEDVEEALEAIVAERKRRKCQEV